MIDTREKEADDTIFQVLQSHGRIDECIEFAEKIKRYDTVIVHYINKQDFRKALLMIAEIEQEDKRNAEMTRYASLFLNKCAKDTIEQLQRSQYKNIDIPKLMPSFQNIQRQQEMKYARDFITDYCIGRK